MCSAAKIKTYLPVSIERSCSANVKGAMDRVRLMLASLLPALLLVTSGQSLLDPVDWRNERFPSFVGTSQRAKKEPRAHSSSFTQTLRIVKRRSPVDSGPEGLSIDASLPALSFPVAETLDFSICSFETAPDLATTWQFFCRNALEPRAPSSLV